ncbi:spore protease YyaC [Radiobacillus sp. PE A8.2]|uniref:spore protease YyaC n=1 Tax=Radiobacillus sp. PE A8.2 TaxID=3380349 RepID=UPI0038906D27
MNLINRKPKKSINRFDYYDPSFANKMANVISPWLPSLQQPIIVICIGTDRSTGDSLGPLTGSLVGDLHEITLYGTLEEPIHAVNLLDKLHEINNEYQQPFIIAVDACLGGTNSIGTIMTEKGPLKPGAALNKQLPAVGDIHISAVVNRVGHMDYTVLQNTRLHIVMEMAKKIAQVIQLLDTYIYNNKIKRSDT